MIRPSIIVAQPAVESYGQNNAGAITSAANPVAFPSSRDVESTFQVAQSRVGLELYHAQVSGKFEFDFIDFAKSSPTVQAVPRLRIAMIDWAIDANNRLSAGQGWDMFSPMNPHHINFVGGHFQSGNTGFMRHQVQYHHAFDGWELGVAAGLAGNNATPAFSALELSAIPTGALRFTHKLDRGQQWGASAIYTYLEIEKGHRSHSFAVNFFGEFFPTQALNIRFETYVGSNAANLGMLALGRGTINGDVEEAGGWISLKLALGEHFSVYASGAGAFALSPSEVELGYTRDDAGVVSRVNGKPGFTFNASGRLGVEYKPLPELRFAIEPFVHATKFKLAPEDIQGFNALRVASGGELGAVYTF
jgi:hypothetical protein